MIYILKMKNVKELWDALKQKYESEDAGWKRLQGSRLFEFKIIYNKPCMK